jgi:hypothetical protein
MRGLANSIQLKLEVGFLLDLYISYYNLMSKCQMILVELETRNLLSRNTFMVDYMHRLDYITIVYLIIRYQEIIVTWCRKKCNTMKINEGVSVVIVTDRRSSFKFNYHAITPRI